MTATPRTVRAVRTMTRIRSQQARRDAAARNGYRGPLTRADLAELAERRARTAYR